MPQQTFNVPANVKWFSTGIRTGNAYGITITADPNDTWTANPSNGPYNANGSGIQAKLGYCVSPGIEGALVAKSLDINGLQDRIQVSMGITHQFRFSGDLYLSINDDENGQWGKGFADNRGSIRVTVTY